MKRFSVRNMEKCNKSEYLCTANFQIHCDINLHFFGFWCRKKMSEWKTFTIIVIGGEVCFVFFIASLCVWALRLFFFRLSKLGILSSSLRILAFILFVVFTGFHFRSAYTRNHRKWIWVRVLSVVCKNIQVRLTSQFFTLSHSFSVSPPSWFRWISLFFLRCGSISPLLFFCMIYFSSSEL